MPNWTSSNVRVRASKPQEIADFMNKYFTERGGEFHFDFNKVIPEPDSKETCPSEYICDCKKEGIEDARGGNWFNWYKYHNEKWGTKWNACDTQTRVNEDGTELYIDFLTAWAAPHPIFRELKRQNGHLRIRVESEDE